MATPRANLFVNQAYFEYETGQYFWTPDKVGCFWFDTEEECLAESESDFIITIEKLED